MPYRKIETTEDGSSTLFVPELEEHYHSIHGAIQESNHVFIEAGLQQLTQADIVIFEVGFGTGLNTILSYLHAAKTKQNIKYITIEKYPLTKEEIATLNYPQQLNTSRKIFEKIHFSDWNQWESISETFQLFKIHGDLQSTELKGFPPFNIIFFDAFAPNKQPKLWNQETYQKIYQNSANNSIFTTYCAKGIVRRDLQAVGYKMERISGPPGKKEMLRGIK